MSSPESIRLCARVKTNGVRCNNPALRGERYCYFHNRTIGRAARVDRMQHPMPLLEDANAIQVAIGRVIDGVLDGGLDTKKASVLLYALQTASLNLKQMKLTPFWRDVVLEDEDAPLLDEPKPPQRSHAASPLQPKAGLSGPPEDERMEMLRKMLSLGSEEYLKE